MIDCRPVDMDIRVQGAPLVNVGSSYIHAGGVECGCAAVCVDMRSKYCEVFSVGRDADGTPLVDIEATPNSRHLLEGSDLSRLTTVGFPQFKGWRVFAANLTRYTLAVALAKEA